MEFKDRILRCGDCGQDFVFTAGEQLFFFDKQFKNDPKRCKPCKARRAGAQPRVADSGKPMPITRTETRTTCSSCGIETTVPFRPTQGRPVLCRSCFQQKPAISPSATANAVAEMAAAASLEQMEGMSLPELALDVPPEAAN